MLEYGHDDPSDEVYRAFLQTGKKSKTYKRWLDMASRTLGLDQNTDNAVESWHAYIIRREKKEAGAHPSEATMIADVLLELCWLLHTHWNIPLLERCAQNGDDTPYPMAVARASVQRQPIYKKKNGDVFATEQKDRLGSSATLHGWCREKMSDWKWKFAGNGIEKNDLISYASYPEFFAIPTRIVYIYTSKYVTNRSVSWFPEYESIPLDSRGESCDFKEALYRFQKCYMSQIAYYEFDDIEPLCTPPCLNLTFSIPATLNLDSLGTKSSSARSIYALYFSVLINTSKDRTYSQSSKITKLGKFLRDHLPLLERHAYRHLAESTETRLYEQKEELRNQKEELRNQTEELRNRAALMDRTRTRIDTLLTAVRRVSREADSLSEVVSPVFGVILSDISTKGIHEYFQIGRMSGRQITTGHEAKDFPHAAQRRRWAEFLLRDFLPDSDSSIATESPGRALKQIAKLLNFVEFPINKIMTAENLIQDVSAKVSKRDRFHAFFYAMKYVLHSPMKSLSSELYPIALLAAIPAENWDERIFTGDLQTPIGIEMTPFETFVPFLKFVGELCQYICTGKTKCKVTQTSNASKHEVQLVFRNASRDRETYLLSPTSLEEAVRHLNYLLGNTDGPPSAAEGNYSIIWRSLASEWTPYIASDGGADSRAGQISINCDKCASTGQIFNLTITKHPLATSRAIMKYSCRQEQSSRISIKVCFEFEQAGT